MNNQRDDDERKAELERLRQEVERDRELLNRRWSTIHAIMDPIKSIKEENNITVTFRRALRGRFE